MSFVKDALFGTKGSPSQVVNTTPQAFQGMAAPLAQQLMQLMRSPQQYQGQLAAPMGAGEQQALTGVQGAAGQVGGYSNPFAANFGDIQQQAFGYNPLQNAVKFQLQTIAGGGPNPMIDQLIQSATRPILEQFGDDQLAQRGAFTAAGHQVQGRGSSPFAQASARLSGNAMNAVGDVGVKIAGQEQQRQMQALQLGMQQPGMQLQNMLGAANFGTQQGQQQLAGQMAQLEAQMANLQSQGLPRLVQQLGIDAGLAQFQNQQQQLLQLMQLMGGLASPNAAVLPGISGQQGMLGSLLGGIGSGVGTGLGAMMVSDRRMKRDIEHVATLPSGTKLYRFRYIWNDVQHIGVMADEVPHAATVDEITGIATVDYRKVA